MPPFDEAVKVRAEAAEAAAVVKEAAAADRAEAAEIQRAARAELEALDAEQAAFQTKKTNMDVGGYTFTPPS